MSIFHIYSIARKSDKIRNSQWQKLSTEINRSRNIHARVKYVCKLNRIEALCKSLMQNLQQLPPTVASLQRRWGSFWSFGFIHPNQKTNTRHSSSARTAAPGSQKEKQIFKSSCKALVKLSTQPETDGELLLLIEKPHSLCYIPSLYFFFFFYANTRCCVVVIYLYICHWVFW